MDFFYDKDKSGGRLLGYAAAIGLIALLGLWNGCGIEKTDEGKVSDLAYEIAEEDALPQELKAKIEEKKASDFKLTYESDKFLYIVRGYGEQETGGYSIQVPECYLTKNAVVFKTNLIGPSKEEARNEAPSYPYIVIKTENLDKNVVFQ